MCCLHFVAFSPHFWWFLNFWGYKEDEFASIFEVNIYLRYWSDQLDVTFREEPRFKTKPPEPMFIIIMSGGWDLRSGKYIWLDCVFKFLLLKTIINHPKQFLHNQIAGIMNNIYWNKNNPTFDKVGYLILIFEQFCDN